MSIKTKLILLSALPLCGLMLGITFLFFLVRNTNRELDYTRRQYAVEIELARRMQFDVVQIQQFLTDYSATRGKEGLDDGLKEAEIFRNDFLDCIKRFTTLAQAGHEDAEVRTMGELSSSFAAYWENGLKMAQLYAQDGTEAGNKFMPEFDKAAKELTGRIEPFVTAQKQQFDDALSDVQSANQRVATVLITGGLLLVAVALAFCIWVVRSISSSILRSVVSMHSNVVLTSSVARRISESSGALADGANDQAAAVEETSSSLEEISSMTKQNSDHAQKANDLAKDTRVVAERGVSDMREMDQAMERIKVSSSEISAIIKTIDEIAFQTNILALNAAVEAARAGEAGAGFAVVAEEVRNLAQRSAQAARETATKIEGAIGNTTRGVELSSKVAQTLNDIATKARDLDSIASELATASGEQALGIGQINEAVAQVDKVTQNNAASAQDNASAAKDLIAQTAVLKEAIEHLMEFLGESTKQGPAPRGKGRGVIQWNENQMTTSVPSIDEQHRRLIDLINAVHETVQKGRGGDDLMRQLNYLGEYAQDHFAHEEKIMVTHHCPIAGKNKEAHARFLRDYQALVQSAHQHGPTPELGQDVKKLLGDWLTSHICKIDTNLRGCHA
ncbi:MAG: bacteriohemerythrin [Opitutaceae bacterium]|nr:bacteriohemerythrin [Opitutaceae bacterium]